MSLTLLSSSGSASPAAFTIAVTSGKGGVGKTSVAVNLAVALARLGRRVALVDADFALGNIDVRLGLTPSAHLGAVLDGDCSLDEITMAGPLGIDVIPSGSGIRELAALTAPQWARLSGALAHAAVQRDFVIVDTASGVADTVIDLVGLTDYALVVTSHDQAALVDAYAVIKLLTAADRAKPIGVVVNAARSEREAERVFFQLSRAAVRFLNRDLRDDGYITEDPRVRAASNDHAPLADGLAGGPASRCFRRLAARLAAARPTTPGPGPATPAMAMLPRADDALSEAPRCA